MIPIRRCSTNNFSKAWQPIEFIARRAGMSVRNFAATSSLYNGSLADVCNIHVVSSPYAPITDSSTLAPVSKFVSSGWTSTNIAQKVAIRDGSTGETRTFSDYHIRMNRIASALKMEYDLKPNETISIFSPNNVDYLPICLAVGLCGAKIVPINPLYTALELSKILVPSHTKILFTHAKLLPVALDAMLDAPCVEHIIVIPDVQSDANIPEGAEHLEQLTAYSFVEDNKAQYGAIDVKNHPFLLPYSSGTTGLSKGCMLSHANIVANLLQVDETERRVFHQHHKLISPLPFFHIYGLLVSLIYCGWRGQEIITMSDRFDLERFCQIVQEHRPERAHLVPPVSDACFSGAKNYISCDGYLMLIYRCIFPLFVIR
jgi:long-subunit acyl-CoA synthetase (AMP-forming)